MSSFSVSFIITTTQVPNNSATLLLHSEESSSHFDAINRLGGLLARNQTKQDAPDWVKLGGVDEGVGTDVYVCDKQYGGEEALVKRECGIDIQKEMENLTGCPGDGEQHADDDHGLDDVGLNLF